MGKVHKHYGKRATKGTETVSWSRGKNQVILVRNTGVLKDLKSDVFTSWNGPTGSKPCS
jgi:hypothetical protein